MNKLKQIFFTSDWHMGHANSIKFDNRPFKDLDDMHKSIIRNFNKKVPKDGLTYFLGDILICGTEQGKELLSQLNGTKVLIVGNHDKAYQASYNAGFDVVLNSATLYIQNNKVTISHCPLLETYREDTSEYPEKGANWHGEYKNQMYSVRDEGQFHLHGHIHSPNNGKSVKILDRQFDVGLPANNYRPVHISEIESWITKYKNKEVK